MSAAIIGLMGVILGSLLTGFKDWLTHHFKRKGNGRYAAVRLIAVLDEYAQSCVSVVSHDGTCEGRPAGRTEQGEEYYVPQSTKPEPPSFPDDIDWRSVSFKLTYRILSLPNDARETDRYIAASAENSFPPDYDELFSARQEGYAHLGLESVNLVKDLRHEFRLPDTPKKFWDWGWDMEKFFQDKLAEFQKHRQISGKNEGLDL
ncbi:hypothetical protein GOZ96_14500 [Agrobacterium vitis]|uniref:Uncharacterized protein n=1 Tax=Agrobacterium vitis TaxID=373 RepID=A0A368NX30_AGRVI|nr:hypothetical protein [Agrobacterium vitis]KAA3514869.1 hypothetical protein DXM22_13870 [Agrobacterium vitis]KAA3528334.1 hypothetical protein DXT89_09940 [Agrobacterium vitis]MUZ97819.1 hypothetical protein [Agrobacterium vitis]MVA31075.1 hypothetical protein [Agrobacterium vitis]NOJ35636.1 hypothetical protein [Agrobacterium vitis]